MKLKIKLNFLFVLLVAFSVLLVGGTSYFTAKEALKNKTLDGLQATLNSKIKNIYHAIELRKEQAIIISGTYLLKQLQPSENKDTSLLNKIQKHIDFISNEIQLSTSSENENSLENISVLDANGNIIASTKHDLIGIKTNYENIKKLKTNSTYFSGYNYDSLTGNNNLIIYSSIINQQNEFAGGVILMFNTNTIKNICYNFEGLGRTGEIILTQKINDTAQFIIPLRNTPNTPKIIFGSEKELPTQLSLSGNTGRGSTQNYNGVEVLSVWKPMNKYGWGIALEIYAEEAYLPIVQLRNNVLFFLFITLLIAFTLSHFFSSAISRPIVKLTKIFSTISKGETPELLTINTKDELGQLALASNETIAYFNQVIQHARKLSEGNYNNNILPKSENDKLGNALQRMTENLRMFDEENKNTIWLQNAIAKLNEFIRGDLSTYEIAERSLQILVNTINAHAGVMYEFSEQTNLLKYVSGYAISNSTHVPSTIQLGEGIAGQAAKEKKMLLLNKAPHNYLKISSSLGEMQATYIVALPLVYHGNLKGVVEMATLKELNKVQLKFLDAIFEIIAIAFSSAQNRKRIQELLEESQAQTEELSAQQEELQQQTNRLMASEEELKMQQEELIQNNKQLEEKGILLEQKASELEKISRYKSEFLANMSHELRTPLNSILLLSKLLSDNSEKNLTVEQTEYSRIIHNSGNNLLQLISDILDLTKIEAGKSEMQIEPTDIRDICKNLDDTFLPLAKEKNIIYTCKPKGTIPPLIITDGFRVEQILKNIVSNAFKFTEKGSIAISVSEITAEEAKAEGLSPIKMMRFEISDTGIGIPSDVHHLIFNAFQQADGTTRRKFGGTGLGLSISKRLANILGGDITLKSKPGMGSTFTLYIPCNSSHLIITDTNTKPTQTEKDIPTIPINIDAKKVLIVEDNKEHLLALTMFLESKFFICEGVNTATEAYKMLENSEVNCIILDMDLPDAKGFEVLERIKNNTQFHNIPVIIYTGTDISQKDEHKLKKYATAIVIKTANSYQRLADELSLLSLPTNTEKKKPYTKDAALSSKTILIVDDDVRNVYALTKVLENQQMQVSSALNGKEALAFLEENQHIEIILMDIMMPEMDGYETIKEIRKNPKWKKLPIIALTAKAMLGDREKCISAGASDYLTKPVNVDQLLSLIKIWLYK
jgi:two-component system chemotaxis sensor kinase CheA